MAIQHIKRKNPWRVTVRLGRKRLTKTFARKIDAENWEHKIVSARNDGVLNIRAPDTNITLDGLRNRFDEEYSLYRQAPSTRIMAESLYRNYIGSDLGSTLISKLGKKEMIGFFHYLSQDLRVANGRVNRVRQLLHCMFNRAVEWDLLQVNPITSIRPLPVQNHIGDENIRYLTQDEADRLLAWLRISDSWLYPKVLVLLKTGIRYGEMVALQASDFIHSSYGGELMVSKTYCRHTFQIRERTKGGKSRRLPLGTGMAEFLASLAEGKQPDQPLLWKDRTEHRYATKFQKHFRHAIKATGVRNIRIHDARHSYAVHFLENGGQLYDLQKLLGHHSIRLTERYSHFSHQMSERVRGIVDIENSAAKTPAFTVMSGGERPAMTHKRHTKPNFTDIDSASADCDVNLN